MKFSAHSTAHALDHVKSSRRWFRNLLWKAFPSSSERELSLKASRALGVTPRQVLNWLSEENDASLRYITAVAAMAGVEWGFSKLEK